MRIYEFSPATGYTGSLNYKKFLDEIADRINTDEHIIARSKECNREYTRRIKEALENSENELYMSTISDRIACEIPRYAYIKHLMFNGKEYEVEIDEMKRLFNVVEIDD